MFTHACVISILFPTLSQQVQYLSGGIRPQQAPPNASKYTRSWSRGQGQPRKPQGMGGRMGTRRRVESPAFIVRKVFACVLKNLPWVVFPFFRVQIRNDLSISGSVYFHVPYDQSSSYPWFPLLAFPLAPLTRRFPHNSLMCVQFQCLYGISFVHLFAVIVTWICVLFRG
jgi:hypothetical protein